MEDIRMAGNPIEKLTDRDLFAALMFQAYLIKVTEVDPREVPMQAALAVDYADILLRALKEAK
jgi:hypothetical protein